MIGKMVKSKSGHDKNQIYLVIQMDESFVYLCDGQLKRISNPKKKNKKHVQIINAANELEKKIISSEKYTDEEIKRTIKLYRTKIGSDI